MNASVNYQKYNVNRLIQVSGQTFVFKRCVPDKYGDKTGSITEITISGFYHETSSQVNTYVKQSGHDGSVTKTKPEPKIMCTVETGSLVCEGDELTYKGEKMKVTGVTNISKLDICADISLEVV